MKTNLEKDGRSRNLLSSLTEYCNTQKENLVRFRDRKRTDLHLVVGVVLLRPFPIHDEGVEGDCGRVVERQGDGAIVVPDGKLVGL